MDRTLNCHANSSLVLSNGDETHLLFLLNKPALLEDGTVKIVQQEQVLISIPFGYSEVLANALMDNVRDHKAKLAEAAEKERHG